jgi:hypothetical protein
MRAVEQTRESAPAGQLQNRVEQALLWLRPNGWQGRARRNAWSAMVADSQRRQSRMLVARETAAIDTLAGTAAPAAAVPAARAR